MSLLPPCTHTLHGTHSVTTTLSNMHIWNGPYLVIRAVRRQAVRGIGAQAHRPHSKQGVGASGTGCCNALSCQREVVL
jgi:hypothetical protein